MKTLLPKKAAAVPMLVALISLGAYRAYAPPAPELPFDSYTDANPNPNETDVSTGPVTFGGNTNLVLNSLTLHGYSSEPATSGWAVPPDTGSGAPFSANSFFDVFADVTVNGTTYHNVNGVGSLSDNASSDTLPGSTTFNTEMLTLNLSGGGLPSGMQFREDPSRQSSSTGQTMVQDIGGGQFQISSFFDIFTEISLDAGQTWAPANNSLVLVSLPEPSEAALLVAGGLLLTLTTVRRQRRLIRMKGRP
jgi:hypothetical protein